MDKDTKLGKRIKNLRMEIDWSQEKLAKELGIPRPSVSQIETGQRDISSWEAIKLSRIFGISIDELLNPVTKEKKVEIPAYIRKLPEFNKEVFKQILLYILGKCGARPNVGKTVLYKLLYFCDFNYYELYEEYLTGSVYRKISYGPVPCNFDKIVKDMIKNKELQEVKMDYFGEIQTKYLPLIEPDLNKLTARQKDLIDRVIEILSSLDARKISEYLHEDVPWKATKEKEIIDYELVFYRTDPYSVRYYPEE